MNEKLDLETFNRSLMGEMKEDSHLIFLKSDLEAVMASMIREMINLVDALNNNMPYHDILKKINNMDSDCTYLEQKIKELEGVRNDKN